MQWSMGRNCGMRPARRLLLLTAVAACGSLVLSAPAFAQGGLGSITNAGVPQTGTSLDKAVDDNLEAAAPILDSASPALDAGGPVVEAADPVVQKTATPVLQVAAPVLDTAAPVLETTTPVVQAAATVAAPVTQPVSDVTASALGTVDELMRVTKQAGAPTVGPAQDNATPAPADTTSVRAVRTNPEVSSGGEASVDTELGGSRNIAPVTPSRGPDVTRHAASSATQSQSLAPTTWASDSWTPVPGASDSHPATSAKAPRVPSRHGPSVPATPSSISAGSFGGGALLVFAALAVLLLLAAPGMSRRLRLVLALPPLPVALSPLERPG
jgi:hypothetical protein